MDRISEVIHLCDFCIRMIKIINLTKNIKNILTNIFDGAMITSSKGNACNRKT